MDTKHTPKPWRVIQDGGFRGIFHLGTGRKIAAVIGSVAEGDHIEANASLIAAAPDLLETVLRLLGRMYLRTVDIPGDVEAIEAARALVRRIEEG